MFCVHVAGDELDALTHELRQNGFANSVNRCHVDQLNDAPPRIPYVARFSPSRLEFLRPLADQTTLQTPPLLSGQIGDGDLEHYFPFDCRQNRRRDPLQVRLPGTTKATFSLSRTRKDMTVEEPKRAPSI